MIFGNIVDDGEFLHGNGDIQFHQWKPESVQAISPESLWRKELCLSKSSQFRTQSAHVLFYSTINYVTQLPAYQRRDSTCKAYGNHTPETNGCHGLFGGGNRWISPSRLAEIRKERPGQLAKAVWCAHQLALCSKQGAALCHSLDTWPPRSPECWHMLCSVYPHTLFPKVAIPTLRSHQSLTNIMLLKPAPGISPGSVMELKLT